MLSKVQGGWVVKNESGTKRLSKVYHRKEDAQKRLREIEYHKSKK